MNAQLNSKNCEQSGWITVQSDRPLIIKSMTIRHRVDGNVNNDVPVSGNATHGRSPVYHRVLPSKSV
jgi:hypothetical protein